MLKNKKIVCSIVMIIIIVILSVILIASITKHGSYKEITFEQLENKIENKDSFILFIGAASCSHCNEYKNMIKQLKLKVVFYYIDLEKITVGQSEWIELKYNLTGTPLTEFIEKGEAVDYLNGANYTKLLKKLRSNNYIKGE